MQHTRMIVVLLATLVAGNALAGRHGGPGFTELDTDGDGLLSAAELAELPTCPGCSAEDRFARLDADADGYVSQDELRNAPRGARGKVAAE